MDDTPREQETTRETRVERITDASARCHPEPPVRFTSFAQGKLRRQRILRRLGGHGFPCVGSARADV